MKIKRISWWNYRGLDDGEIIAGGADVIVRGQNGVGKTSIASIVPFVLFDNERDKVKPFVNGEVTRDPNLYSGAEVEFDNGKISNFRLSYGEVIYIDLDHPTSFTKM